MKTYFIPARQVFEFNKAGGEVTKSAPTEAPKAPAAAPTDQDAQKAREATAKRIAELEDRIRKVEADDSMAGSQKAAIIEQSRREIEAARGAPVLSPQQHQKTVGTINDVLTAPQNTKTQNPSTRKAPNEPGPGYQSTWDGNAPKKAPPPVNPSGKMPDYQRKWRDDNPLDRP
jgi:hypothetical protein